MMLASLWAVSSIACGVPTRARSRRKYSPSAVGCGTGVALPCAAPLGGALNAGPGVLLGYHGRRVPQRPAVPDRRRHPAPAAHGPHDLRPADPAGPDPNLVSVRLHVRQALGGGAAHHDAGPREAPGDLARPADPSAVAVGTGCQDSQEPRREQLLRLPSRLHRFYRNRSQFNGIVAPMAHSAFSSPAPEPNSSTAWDQPRSTTVPVFTIRGPRPHTQRLPSNSRPRPCLPGT